MAHPGDEALRADTLGTLTTAQSLRLQAHIFHCPDCLTRLKEIELLLALPDASVGRQDSAKAEMRKPLFIRHDTVDGFIYLRVEKRGRKWLALHWGEQLNGQQEFLTMREAGISMRWPCFRRCFPSTDALQCARRTRPRRR